MSKKILGDVFLLLRGMGVVSSESEFCMDWLGRSECYLRTLRFKGSEPSIATLAICASKLQHYAGLIESLVEYKAESERFYELSELCHKEINLKSKSLWCSSEIGSTA
ncbi:DUF6626 family protein [Halomonas sp. GFAJ-1]|uniref:DUF6626 family protein n=1 Tax=Halomonas sp. GFAJ-1 TaxID=1118153 RepID=UPI00023A206D|nr:hypothetical protein BB497_07240 [Halomonas sp. GFAJ-1]EHK59514.1 hypothetical protein MOY_16023 [Halomonas sp. GFAJ-1]